MSNQKLTEIRQEVARIIRGKDDVILKIVASILAEGHILMEDIPGVGKTTLATTFAKTMSLKYHRVQFTPDVMPSDITGFSMFNPQTRQFEYHTGAAMCNLLLADEINRTSPKTQSALLEVMEEGKVKTYIVEGILDGDPNSQDEPEFILPLDRYLDLMGYTKEDWNGINYRFKNHIFLDDETNDELMYHMDTAYGVDGMSGDLPNRRLNGIMFFELNLFVKPFAKVLLLLAFIIFTVVLINCINIVNTSAANLHMRRKEFAQLKAMGMTDRGLTKAVILEGVIALFFSAIIGISIGMAIMKYMDYMLFVEMAMIKGLVSFPWIAVIFGLLLSATVLIGSLYIPLRNMKRSLQGELTLSGE